MTIQRYNADKPHRCPQCHAVAVGGGDEFSPFRVYTCCQCGTRFTRWPRLAPVLPKVGIRCGEHNSRT